jgi:hypothetical protein
MGTKMFQLETQKFLITTHNIYNIKKLKNI